MKELRLKQNLKRGTPLWDSSLYAKHLSLYCMFHIRF